MASHVATLPSAPLAAPTKRLPQAVSHTRRCEKHDLARPCHGRCVLLVTHYGVIEKLCGQQRTLNGAIVECDRCRVTGKLTVVKVHTPPQGA